MSDIVYQDIDYIDIDNKNKVDIILCVDEKDRFPMYTLINSIIQNEKEIDRLSFHILVLQNAPLFVKEVEHYFGEYSNEISFEFESIMDDHPECIEYAKVASRHIPKAHDNLNTVMNHARFCVPNVFKDVEIAIYLDADMIVQDSISKLYDDYYNTHNYTAWSVMNRIGSHYISGKHEEEREFVDNYLSDNLRVKYPSVIKKLNWNQLQKDKKNIFNAGVLMFNWTIWRSQQFTEQTLALHRFNKISQVKFGKRLLRGGVTQPLINMLFIVNGVEIGELEERWNFIVKDLIGKEDCHSFVKQDDRLFLENQSILHFADICKPWTVQHLNVGYMWTKYIPKKANIKEWEKTFGIKL